MPEQHGNVKKKKKKRKNPIKKSKIEIEKEKLEAEIHAFVNSEDLHGAFVARLNNWVREHKSRAIDLFRKFDSDGDGTLSHSEFQDGMRDLNAPCSNIELHVLTRLLDSDRNGKIDYNEFSKGVRYFKPEETIPDDGLPVLRILREELEPCAHCKLKLWKPHDVKFPRFIQIDMKLLTFLRIQNYPGHFRILVHSHITVQGLIDIINERHGRTLRHVRIYHEDSRGERTQLGRHKTLEECGFHGAVKTKPQKLELIYDFTTEFHDCPILMSDDYFIRENPKHAKDL